MFIKFYRPEEEKLSYVGSVNVCTAWKLGELFPVIRGMLNVDAPSFLLFEEVKESMQNLLSPHKTFAREEIGNGDIIVVRYMQLWWLWWLFWRPCRVALARR